jgi:chemotaxis protein MotA
MDIGTIIGLIFGFGVIAYSILMGGSLTIFVDIPSMFIVVGGMLCAVMIHFSLPQFFSVFSIVKKTFMVKVPSPPELIQKMVNFATISRRDGALALEEQIRKIDSPFLKRSLQMLVDGQEETNIREMLDLEIQYLQERHAQGKKLLEFMSSSAPAFGMIGTLIGLVQMLRNMTSPESIGAGMAVALITTFYGAILSNLVFTPLAGKLGIYSKAETLAMEMTVSGICAISRGENPTMVKEKMQTFISPGRRQEVKATV